MELVGASPYSERRACKQQGNKSCPSFMKDNHSDDDDDDKN